MGGECFGLAVPPSVVQVISLPVGAVPPLLRFKTLVRRCRARLHNGSFEGAGEDCRAAQGLAESLGMPDLLTQAQRLELELVRERARVIKRQEALRASWSKSLQGRLVLL